MRNTLDGPKENKMKIEARPIYDDPNKEHRCTGDAPEGCVFAYRYRYGARQSKIGQPWPEFAPGQEVEIETTNHYLWVGRVESRIDEDTIIFRPAAPKVAMPLPPVIVGQPYVLPYMSGDAWSVSPEKGKILTIGGAYYQVKNKPRRVNSGYEYQLAPVSAEAHAKRPGRTVIQDLTEPDQTSHNYYGHNVGRIVQIGDEWLHVQKVERVPYGDAEGREIFGYHVFGVGHFVPAAKAEKLKTQWAAKAEIRSLELSLQVAKQDLDYGGNPEAVPCLEAQLAEARNVAGIK